MTTSRGEQRSGSRRGPWLAVVAIVAACGSNRGGAIDASIDAPPGAPDFGRVECRQNVDCMAAGLQEPVCFVSRAGGICTNCDPGGPRVCPDGYMCSPGGDHASFACYRSCSSDRDCNLAQYCADDKLCKLRHCGSNGDPECPKPYYCDTGRKGYCARPRCDQDPCPAPLVCNTGGDLFCLEP